MAELGRPRSINEKVLAKLEEGFLWGFSDREACLYADINPSTLYRFCEENPDFSERKELLKESLKLKSKKNIGSAIDKGDRSLSQWYLERRDKEFSSKNDLTSGGKPIFVPSEILEKYESNSSTEGNSAEQV